MKTAIIISGVCRQTNLTYRFWDKLPQGDIYFSTWNIVQQVYEKEIYKLTDEVEQLQRHIPFKKVFISDYQKEFLEAGLHPFIRSFILLRKVHEHIKTMGYERVIYFRPDIKLYYLDSYDPQTEFTVSYNSIKILGDFEPEFFCDYEKRTMNDLFFVFPWRLFEAFVNNAEYICLKEIHNSLFEFFETWQIKIEPIQNMRCVILRDNINESNINLTVEELTNLFLTVFKEKDSQGKFVSQNEVIFTNKTLNINHKYLEYSQKNGGILKIRNR